MRAIMQCGYGAPHDVLRPGEIQRPEAGEGEVLVQVVAASVHADVWHVVTGLPKVLRLFDAAPFRPRHPVPGTAMAGVVESHGTGVSGFHPGDEVFGETIRGYRWTNGGAYAEYVSAPAIGLAAKPERLTFEQAATVPTSGLITMMNLPEDAVGQGSRVLINGGAGGVGSIALQVAKSMGGVVTGVDHTSKLDLMRALGADHVVDYTKEDFTEGAETYDLIFDIPANHPFSAYERVLGPGGRYVMIGHEGYGSVGGKVFGGMPGFFAKVMRAQMSKGSRGIFFSPPPKDQLMGRLITAIDSGSLTPVIDRVYPLSQTADAIEYLATGGAMGGIVVAPEPG